MNKTLIDEAELQVLRDKAAAFDWLETSLDEAKLRYIDGNSEWLYHNCGPNLLYKLQVRQMTMGICDDD